MQKQSENLWLVIVLIGGGFLMIFAFILVLMLSFIGIETDLSGGPSLGVLEIEGVIEDSKEALEALHEFAMDEDIKGILVRINSPGGSVAPSQEIYSELMKLRGKKPVVASMGSLAASGGYYIACGAERIFASPGTITGSIGVIIQSTYLKDLMKFLKVSPVTYKSGKHKDILSPFRKASVSEKVIIDAMIDDVYDQFLSAVAESRELDKEQLRPIADGRILSGRQALGAKLVDQLGTYRDAVLYLSDKAGLGDDPKLKYPKEETLSYIEKMFESSLKGVIAASRKASTSVEYRMEQ